MCMMTPEVWFALHEARHRRLLTDAEVRHRRRIRVRAEWPSGTWARIVRILRGGWVHPDAKIDQLCDSWLAPRRRAATRLAQAADVVAVPAGTVLAPGRFAYIGLDQAHAGLVVTDGTPSVALTADAVVLVLSTRSLQELSRHIPMLLGAMARATPSPGPDRRSSPALSRTCANRGGSTAPRTHVRTGADQPTSAAHVRTRAPLPQP